MKYIVYLIFLNLYLHAAQLILNRYEEKTQSLDIYHVVDQDPIDCRVSYGEGFEKVIRCRFQKTIDMAKKIRDDSYFKIVLHANSITFYAKRYAKLLPIDIRLKEKTRVEPQKRYRHWTIIGSRTKPEILQKSVRKAFNFPVDFQKKPPPYVGALDLNGEPIAQKKGAIYLAKIKKLYRQRKYRNIVKLADRYAEEIHDTFHGDIELFRLRALSELAKQRRAGYETLLEKAKEWVEAYPSNAHIPEVYTYIVQSYLGKGRFKEGEKYLNLLESGFPKNEYTYRAQIIYADTIYRSKKRRTEALKIYKKVLYKTKNLDTASLAALRIANAYLDRDEPTKAQEIFAKVLKSNPQFIQSHTPECFALAKRFGKYEKYDIALDILDLLHATGDKDIAEEMQKLEGFWEEKRGETEKAIAAYNAYLKKYKEGRYREFVKKHLDLLMMMQTEQNQTKKMQLLDQILKKYSDKDIQRKALLEKVKLLYSQKKYREILDMADRLRQLKLQKWIGKSARMLTIEALEKEQCERAVTTMAEYNVTVETKYDASLLQCYEKTGKYSAAEALAEKHIGTEDLHEKLQWLYLAAKLYKKMDLNKKVILVATDALKLAKQLHEKRYDDLLYDIAEAYYNLREYDDLMLDTVKKIEERFPDDIRNIDLFMKVVRYAQKRKDLMLEINYAKKVIDLKRKYKVHAYSPRIEIEYAHALQRAGKYDKALSVVLDLLTKKLTDTQKAEVLYLAGELSLQMHKTKEAKAFYLKCGEIVKESSWQKLCAEHLEILSE